MKTFIIISIILIIVFGLFYSFSGYKSAFEADQECHYLWNMEYGNEASFGCDHDIETSQWLFYEMGNNNEPAKVIKRFRY